MFTSGAMLSAYLTLAMEGKQLSLRLPSLLPWRNKVAVLLSEQEKGSAWMISKREFVFAKKVSEKLNQEKHKQESHYTNTAMPCSA